MTIGLFICAYNFPIHLCHGFVNGIEISCVIHVLRMFSPPPFFYGFKNVEPNLDVQLKILCGIQVFDFWFFNISFEKSEPNFNVHLSRK